MKKKRPPLGPDDPPPPLKTSVTIPYALWKAAKMKCLQENKTLAELITEALEKHVGKPDSRAFEWGAVKVRDRKGSSHIVPVAVKKGAKR